jgi:prophage regulatory protein
MSKSPSEDMLTRLRLDAGSRTFGELAQEREWAYREIAALRERLARSFQTSSRQAVAQKRNNESMHARPPSTGLRYLRLREVSARVGLKASGIYRLMAQGSFPKQVKLSERTAAWVESEIESFMDARLMERDERNYTAPEAFSPYMRMGEVLKRTGLTSSQMYDLIRTGEFPKWAPLSKPSSEWIREDVEAWIEARAASAAKKE